MVTERGAPVARLVPVASVGRDHESLRDLERQGLIRVGSGKQKARAPIDGYVPRGGDPAPRAFVPQHPEEAQGVLEARKPRAALAVE